MLKRLMFITTMFLGLQVMAAEDTTVPDTLSRGKATELAIVPEILALAKAVVSDLVKDKTLEEILNMVNEIALELSKKNLCGLEAIQSMLDVGISFDMAYDSIVKSCKLEGPALAALNHSLAPGTTGRGGPGGEVSP